jgi:hypothetical protein
MTRFAAAPLTVTLLALGLVACGGGDAPSQEEFAKNAEQICADQAKHLQDLGKATSPKEFADQLDKAIDETRSSIDDLGELERPEGEAGKKAEQFVNAVETDIEKKGLPVLEDLRDGIKANDEKAVQDAYKRLTALRTTNSSKLAKEIGASSCAD